MKKLFIVLVLSANFSYAADVKSKVVVTQNNPDTVAVSTSEVNVGVKGMVCAFCAQGIEKQFLAQKEVSKVEVSLENKIVKIKFKDGLTLSNEKISQILKDAGYEAVFK